MSDVIFREKRLYVLYWLWSSYISLWFKGLEYYHLFWPLQFHSCGIMYTYKISELAMLTQQISLWDVCSSFVCCPTFLASPGLCEEVGQH